jgi:hypothetical protein
MVKFLVVTCILLFTTLHANSYDYVDYQGGGDALEKKIKAYIDSDRYEDNRDFINIIFSPKRSFYRGGEVNSVKVLATLKENGLLKLHLGRTKNLELHFKTEESPLLFLKIMKDALRNIGYYKYITISSAYDGSEFTWSIRTRSESIIDPLAFKRELDKVNARVVSIDRKRATEWSYKIDVQRAFLRVPSLRYGKKLSLKRSLYAHWVNVKNINKITIVSSRRNHWYPNIAYYDEKLNFVQVVKKDEKTKKISIQIPQTVKYIKISDIYTLKNIKDYLTLYPK